MTLDTSSKVTKMIDETDATRVMTFLVNIITL